MKSNKSNSKEATNRIPDEVINSLARCILPSIRAYFESEEGNREFEEWKATREKMKNGQKDRKDNDMGLLQKVKVLQQPHFLLEAVVEICLLTVLSLWVCVQLVQ